MSSRPAYLLKADEDDMARYRAAASVSGMSFAEFIRQALDEKTANTVQQPPGKPVWLTDPRKRPRP